MTDLQLQQHCAEAVGYANVRWEEVEEVDIDSRSYYLLEALCGDKDGHRRFIPPFPASRDSCAELESTLTSAADQLAYYRALVDGLDRNPDGSHRFGACVYWETTTATARQRCLAFLRVRRPELFRT